MSGGDWPPSNPMTGTDRTCAVAASGQAAAARTNVVIKSRRLISLRYSRHPSVFSYAGEYYNFTVYGKSRSRYDSDASIGTFLGRDRSENGIRQCDPPHPISSAAPSEPEARFSAMR